MRQRACSLALTAWCIQYTLSHHNTVTAHPQSSLAALLNLNTCSGRVDYCSCGVRCQRVSAYSRHRPYTCSYNKLPKQTSS
ncbi:hypothetical protein EDB83DRAFT_2471172 [Lactarius deliciosus]|nr:hypothetical protein EDB83DRAFT_2471172 [Lactarius deliciosus]